MHPGTACSIQAPSGALKAHIPWRHLLCDGQFYLEIPSDTPRRSDRLWNPEGQSLWHKINHPMMRRRFRRPGVLLELAGRGKAMMIQD